MGNTSILHLLLICQSAEYERHCQLFLGQIHLVKILATNFSLQYIFSTCLC